MGTGTRLIGLGMAAALLATSMPAMARPRYGYPGGGWGHGGYGYGYGHGHGHHDNFDFGDFLLGAVIAGGIAAAVASSNSRKKNGTSETVLGDQGSGTFGHESTNHQNDANDQDAAADACTAAAERQASRYASDARVTDINVVSRDGEGWRVEGVVESGNDQNYRDRRSFQCGFRYGQVDFVQLGNSLAVR